MSPLIQPERVKERSDESPIYALVCADAFSEAETLFEPVLAELLCSKPVEVQFSSPFSKPLFERRFMFLVSPLSKLRQSNRAVPLAFSRPAMSVTLSPAAHSRLTQTRDQPLLFAASVGVFTNSDIALAEVVLFMSLSAAPPSEVSDTVRFAGLTYALKVYVPVSGAVKVLAYPYISVTAAEATESEAAPVYANSVLTETEPPAFVPYSEKS